MAEYPVREVAVFCKPRSSLYFDFSKRMSGFIEIFLKTNGYHKGLVERRAPWILV